MTDFNVGDMIKIKEGSRRADGRYIPCWMFLRPFQIIDIEKDIVTISKGADKDYAPFKLNIDDIYKDDITEVFTSTTSKILEEVVKLDGVLFKNERQKAHVYLRHDSNKPTIGNVQGIRIVDPKIVNGRIKARYLSDDSESWSDEVWLSCKDLVDIDKIYKKIIDKLEKYKDKDDFKDAYDKFKDKFKHHKDKKK